jgi:hypothetical protein
VWISLGADDDGALHADDPRLRDRSSGPEWLGRRHALDAEAELGIGVAFEPTLGDENRIVGTEVGTVLVADREHTARREIDHVGVAAHAALAHALGFEPALRQLHGLLLVDPRHAAIVGDRRITTFAGLDREVTRQIVVALVARLGVFRLGLREQRIVRPFAEVVIAHGVFAGPHIVRDAEVGDELVAADRVGVVDPRDGIAGTRRRRLRRIGQHELVDAGSDRLRVIVLEEEGDPCLLQQATEKRVVSLTVLDAKLELGVLGIELHHGRDLPLGEDLLHDVGHGLVLKDAVIAAKRRAPKVRHEAKEIGGQLPAIHAHRLELLRLRTDPCPRAQQGRHVAFDTRLNAKRRALANDVLQVDLRQPAQGHDGHLERRLQPLADREARRVQGLLAVREEQLQVRHRDGRRHGEPF